MALLVGLLCLQDAEAQGVAAAPSTAQELLLEGVRAFRGERFAEALLTFQRAEALLGRDVSGNQALAREMGVYLGMTYGRLNRHGEALVAFRLAAHEGIREPVADYTLAVSCYRLGMVRRAKTRLLALLAATGEHQALGPRLSLGATRFVAAIEEAQRMNQHNRSDHPDALVRAQQVADLLQKTQEAPTDAEALEWLEETVLAEDELGPTAQRPRIHQAAQRLLVLPGLQRDTAQLLGRIALLPTEKAGLPSPATQPPPRSR